MSDKNEKKVAAPAARETVQEEVYDVAEIAANAQRLFGYSVDLATAAFEYNGVKRSTLAEARKTIKDFAERKVN